MGRVWLTQVEPKDVPTDTIGDRLPTVLGWVNELLDNAESLSEQQYGFVQETADRLEECGEMTKLTEPQIKWLRGLHERLEERLTRPSRSNRRR